MRTYAAEFSRHELHDPAWAPCTFIPNIIRIEGRTDLILVLADNRRVVYSEGDLNILTPKKGDLNNVACMKGWGDPVARRLKSFKISLEDKS